MTKIYLSFLFIGLIGFSASAQTTWDNFEDTRKGTYGFINGTFIPYFGNPDQSGANTSEVVASYTRNQAETFDVLILDAAMADLSDYVSGSSQISIDVWSPAAGIPIQITLENSETALPDNFPTGRHSVYLTETTVAEEWETLTFTFDTQPDAGVSNTDVDRLVLLFNPDTNTDDQYFWDNLQGPELADDPCEGVTTDPEMLNDFECNQNINFIFSHAGTGFRRVLNPDNSGNASPYVAEYTRNGGEEMDVIIGRFDGNLMITDNSTVQLDVWDPDAPTSVLVSLQAANGDVIIEMSAETSTSSSWETLNFDPSPAAGSTDVAQFVILFDSGNFSSNTYYFDNFQGSNIVSVEELEPFVDFNIYPNPTSDILNFSYSLQETSSVQLAIQDVTGKTVRLENYPMQSAGSQMERLDVGNMSPGIYLYSLTSDKKRSTGKFVVSR